MDNQVVLGLSTTLGRRASKKMKSSNSKHRFDNTNNHPDKPKPTKITIKFSLNPKPEKQSKPEHEEDDALINLRKKKKQRKGEDEDVDVDVDVGEEKKTKKKAMTKTRKIENDDEEEVLECVFPTARITRIIKSEGVDCKITAEAVFLINKATEKFIELFSEDAYGCAVEDHKNFVGYKHLSSAVTKEKLFDFLSDFVPEKVTAEKALAERNPPTTQPC